MTRARVYVESRLIGHSQPVITNANGIKDTLLSALSSHGVATPVDVSVISNGQHGVRVSGRFNLSALTNPAGIRGTLTDALATHGVIDAGPVVTVEVVEALP